MRCRLDFTARTKKNIMRLLMVDETVYRTFLLRDHWRESSKSDLPFWMSANSANSPLRYIGSIRLLLVTLLGARMTYFLMLSYLGLIFRLMDVEVCRLTTQWMGGPSDITVSVIEMTHVISFFASGSRNQCITLSQEQTLKSTVGLCFCVTHRCMRSTH